MGMDEVGSSILYLILSRKEMLTFLCHLVHYLLNHQRVTKLTHVFHAKTHWRIQYEKDPKGKSQSFLCTVWKKFPIYVPRAKKFSSLGLQCCLQNFVIMALLSVKAISLLHRGGDNWPASCDIGALRVDQADVEADLVHISWRGGRSWVERGR